MQRFWNNMWHLVLKEQTLYMCELVTDMQKMC